jgi:DNA-binding SARP family transcriptional activator
MQGTRHLLEPEGAPPAAGARVRRAHATVDLVLRLLGPLEIVWRGKPVPLASGSARSLLALLALSHSRLLRNHAAVQLWPELGTRSSAALRQALWLLRGGFARAGAEPASIIDADEDTICFAAHLIVEVDVIRFEELMRQAPAQHEQAVELYRGDLLEGRGGDCFAWERVRLADLFEDGLASVIRVRLTRGDLRGAMESASRLLERDPLREEAHAALIEIYGRIGSRSQVARQYRRLRQILDSELGVAPLPESEAVYRRALVRTYQRSTDVALVGP